ncbi:transposase IS200-family protein, partial [mine drainage metagenome]
RSIGAGSLPGREWDTRESACRSAWEHDTLGHMDNQPNRSSSHAVYSLKLHIVFVTKYRRKTLAPELLD